MTIDFVIMRTYHRPDAKCVILSVSGGLAEAGRIRSLSDDALRRENTGSHVFLSLYGRVMDAMEDFHITLEAQ